MTTGGEVSPPPAVAASVYCRIVHRPMRPLPAPLPRPRRAPSVQASPAVCSARQTRLLSLPQPPPPPPPLPPPLGPLRLLLRSLPTRCRAAPRALNRAEAAAAPPRRRPRGFAQEGCIAGGGGGGVGGGVGGGGRARQARRRRPPGLPLPLSALPRRLPGSPRRSASCSVSRSRSRSRNSTCRRSCSVAWVAGCCSRP